MSPVLYPAAPKQIYERRCIGGQRYTVMTDTVQTWHSAGKNAGSIAHTYGVGDIKIVEPSALLRNRIDMRCFYNGYCRNNPNDPRGVDQ